VFVGVHDRQLDDQGRLSLPASYRGVLGDKCYLSLGDDGCVTLREASEFENHARELVEREKRGELSRSRRLSMAAGSTLVSIDKQGRITVDTKLRDHAGLRPGAPVTVVGNFDMIEVWRPERFHVLEREGHDEQPTRRWEDES
jgi:MraZ protein